MWTLKRFGVSRDNLVPFTTQRTYVCVCVCVTAMTTLMTTQDLGDIKEGKRERVESV